MPRERKTKVAFIGGGSQHWAPRLIRDLIFKEGLDEVQLELALLDRDLSRAQAIKRLFDVQMRKWGINRVRIYATREDKRALKGADFVLIAISTGGLAAMKHDLEIPERYSIYHTVGDTAGPGGWARILRNIPVFLNYAKQIREFAPDAYVLNYTNPMGALTKVLADELGHHRVIGLCHGFFEVPEVLKSLLGLEREEQIKARFGGLNHFFWLLDFTVDGADGYSLLKKKLRGRPLVRAIHEALGPSGYWLASELYEQYGRLCYLADRHTSEFFGCYLTSRQMMERFHLVRTSIEDRRKGYARDAEAVRLWTEGKETLSKKPSRETAADIMSAVIFDRGFTDVMNMVNIGQISNLPLGAVVETMGYFDRGGAMPLTLGSLPEPLRVLCAPHTEVQLRTVAAGLSGELEAALLALAADPLCAHLTISDVKKMGRELLEANREYLPQFFEEKVSHVRRQASRRG